MQPEPDQPRKTSPRPSPQGPQSPQDDRKPDSSGLPARESAEEDWEGGSEPAKVHPSSVVASSETGQDPDAVRGYWTQERMAKAAPREIPAEARDRPRRESHPGSSTE